MTAAAPEMPAAGPSLPIEGSRARQRLFHAAIELFGKRGYHGVSLRDIADALGQKPPAVYGHVTSKQDLLYQLALIGEHLHRRAIKDALLESVPDPREQLRALVRAHVLVHLQHPDLACVINLESRHLSPEQNADLLASRAQSAELFLDVFDRGARKGLFLVPNPRRVLRAIADLGAHTAQWEDRPDPSELDQIADDYAELALHMLTPSAPCLHGAQLRHGE